jgi:hypothetical protein
MIERMLDREENGISEERASGQGTEIPRSAAHVMIVNRAAAQGDPADDGEAERTNAQLVPPALTTTETQVVQQTKCNRQQN